MPSIRFRLNGVETDIDADPDSSLLALLRGRLRMTGPHFGCGANECGACNVLVGDLAVASCDTPLWSIAGKDVTTIEGLGSAQDPHPLQRAFIAEQAWWIEDYGLFRALHAREGERPWTAWPADLQRLEPAAIDRARRDLAREILYRQYLQWLAATQWRAARAAAHGVALFGDLLPVPWSQ